MFMLVYCIFWSFVFLIFHLFLFWSTFLFAIFFFWSFGIYTQLFYLNFNIFKITYLTFIYQWNIYLQALCKKARFSTPLYLPDFTEATTLDQLLLLYILWVQWLTAESFTPMLLISCLIFIHKFFHLAYALQEFFFFQKWDADTKSIVFLKITIICPFTWMSLEILHIESLQNLT